MTSTSDPAPPRTMGQLPDVLSTPFAKPRLGEELPIFCERCGYNLNGLPQGRCDQCKILHFHCPECGHRQPINTLRPAVQKVLGRLRALALAASVFVKINFFFWLLFAWVGMGVEWSYRHNYEGTRTVIVNGKPVRQQTGPSMIPRPITTEQVVIFCVFAAAFGTVGRMLLLRWRRGWCVGAVLGILVMSMIALGAHLSMLGEDDPKIASAFTRDFNFLIALTGTMVLTAAALVWPIWVMLVNVFLPRPWASAVIDWQSFRPHKASSLARE